MFMPDSQLVDRILPSPNHNGRAVARADLLLLHYTGMPDSDEALERLTSADSKVSSHYVVFEDGRIVQCVPEAQRAFHAGESSWAGATDINSHSIGIEIANPGHDAGCPDFPAVQITAVIALSLDIIKRNGIRPERVLGHSDVAPHRKRDPGEKFPWNQLHAAGIGHWVEPEPIVDGGIPLAPGDEGNAVRDLQKALAGYGYGIETTGTYDERTQIVVAAFQRHFRPALVDGIADVSTRATLAHLMATRPRA